MKKILSAVLAAAMVLSMGVMAFAADVNFGSGTGNEFTTEDGQLTFKKAFVVRGDTAERVDVNNGYDKLESGDVIYFPVHDSAGNNGNGADITVKAAKNWQIKINNAEYVDDADFVNLDTSKGDGEAIHTKDNDVKDNTLFVKVSLTDFSDFTDENVNFYFYIYDTTTKVRSDRVTVKFKMNNYKDTLKEEDLDWVITVAGPKAYKYDSKAKAKNATFDFNGVAFAEVKLFPGETYKVNVNTKYDKDIARLYPEADFEFVELTGDFDKVADVVIPASKDNKFIYEVVDGDLVAVDAEYVKGHKFDSGEKVNGYLFTTNELGKYAISDVELDLEDEDIDLDDDTTSAPVEDNKVNPPMGANDFVGAAVALAVVSVAAAGALALKK